MLDRNCTICGNRENNRIYRVKERMLNRGNNLIICCVLDVAPCNSLIA